MEKEVILKKEKCIGCGACVAIAPANFDFDDDGLSKVIGQTINDDTKNAEETCPVSAIVIQDGDISHEECAEECSNCNCGCGCDEECDCDEDCDCGCNEDSHECHCDSHCCCNEE